MKINEELFRTIESFRTEIRELEKRIEDLENDNIDLTGEVQK